MKHRHLDSPHWTAAAIDSALDRGSLQDWRELFTAVRGSAELADLVLRVARQHDLGGASILATALADRFRPGLMLAGDRPEEKTKGV